MLRMFILLLKSYVALHNMLVEVCMSCNEEESEDFDENVFNNNNMATNNDTADMIANNDTADTAVLDPAAVAINNEDVMFADNAHLLGMTSNQVNLDLIVQYNTAQLLGSNTTRIVERRWCMLCNTEKHFSLLQTKAKVINHVPKHVKCK